MKYLYSTMVLLALCITHLLPAQQLKSHTAQPAGNVKMLQRQKSNAQLPLNPALKPFYHGVASGDPLHDRVIIWTRITPDTEGSIEGTWQVATDPAFSNVVRSGSFFTSAERDYTVKIDVTGLSAGTTYYYYFNALGANSLIGKTKTTPSQQSEQLRFAVVSCNNYEAGYFNAFGRIADRSDLDAVIHLGDYIYEYGNGVYGVDDADRQHIPANEILTLADYRTRYSLYRLDENLRRAHQQHAFVTVWDDHESANDAYKDGAQNHNEGEGSWAVRKAISKRVYNEWMPIREAEFAPLYRKISYGSLMDLLMIDTRLEGREEQIEDVSNPAVYAADRTLLGSTQKAWFLEQLAASTAKWKVVGNQVIFADFNVWWGASAQTGTGLQLESIFLDIWDGYPAERTQILNHIATNNIQNVVMLTGDFHCAFAFDVALRPAAFTGGDPAVAVAGAVPVPATGGTTYNPATGAGSLLVEFATPSICSANFDENLGNQFGSAAAGLVAAQQLQAQINMPLPAAAGPLAGFNPNPHLKYVDLIRHGYFILDLKNDKVQADWYFVNDILTPNTQEAFAKGFFSNDSENRLQESATASTPKSQQDTPAPAAPLVTSLEKSRPQSLTLLSLYPNPASNLCLFNYTLNRSEQVRIALYDLQGKLVAEVLQAQQAPGNYTFTYPVEKLKEGMYILRFSTTQEQIEKKLLIQQ